MTLRPMASRQEVQGRRQVALPDDRVHLGETGPLSQGAQARRKVLRIRYIHGMEVRKKRPRGVKKRLRGSSEPPEPPVCCSLVCTFAFGSSGVPSDEFAKPASPLSRSSACTYFTNPHLILSCSRHTTLHIISEHCAQTV